MNTVRFQEFERYDVQRDVMVVCFMGVTGRGTFHAQLACDRPSERREKRKAFESKVVELMESGEPPQEVDIG
jgi:hypothetical protein